MPPPSCAGIFACARIASTARGVHRPAGEGAVEIDDMKIFKALRLKGQGLGGWIFVEDGGLRHVALLEAHAAAVLEVDGGEKDHGRHLRKLAISAKPRA